jgi:hypothetical protein
VALFATRPRFQREMKNCEFLDSFADLIVTDKLGNVSLKNWILCLTFTLEIHINAVM